MMLGVVLPTFQVGSAAVALGIAEAAVQVTQRHLTTARLEHMNSDAGGVADAARPPRADADRDRSSPGASGQRARLARNAGTAHAAAGAGGQGRRHRGGGRVTDLAMRTCGGAAFGARLGLERLFRDARAPIVMAPTTDQAYDFIGRALCGLEVF